MRRGLLLLSVVLVGLAVVPAATADKPAREVIPGHDDVVFSDECAFPVLIRIEGSEINTTFTDRAGNPVRLLGTFPGNMMTVTNLASGKSITLPATGSFQARLARDGSTSFKVTGHGPFVPNPISGEPGIWYLSGQVSATFDADENMTSIASTGTLVDLCPQLGS
jgi:hypothetical protein